MTKTKTNGGTEIVPKSLTTEEKLDVLLTAVVELTGTMEDLKAQNEEIIEKLANLSLDGDGFQIERFDS